MLDRQTGYPSVDKPWLKYYTEEQINTPLPDCSLYEYLWECNKEHLNDFALNYFGNKITYRRLFSLIDEAARAFTAIGVKEKEIVPVVTVSTVASIVTFYALNKIGAISDFLNVLLEEQDLQGMFEEVHAKTVVALNLFKTKVVNASIKAGVKNILVFGANIEMPAMVNIGYVLKTVGKKPSAPEFSGLISWKDFLKKASQVKEIKYKKNPNETCTLVHTGGTTGEPKAVLLSDNALNISCLGSRQILKPVRKKVFLNIMIPFVVYGSLVCMHDPLCYGLCLAVVPRFDATKWDKYIKKYKPSHVYGVPSYFAPILHNSRISDNDLSQLINMGAGGDGLNRELENALNDYLCEHGCKYSFQKGYGLSEVGSVCVQESQDVNRVGSVGVPLIHNNLMIYDTERKCELPYGEIGEICIQSPSRMIGYLDNEEATSELFKKHPDGSEWLHTGDLGYIDEDGFLYLVGRMKRVILTTRDGVAYKVFPNIPERVLASLKSVEQSCIVGAKNGDDDVLRAYVVLKTEDRDKTTEIEKELRRICNEELPSYSRPTFYVFLDKLPLTAAGKVDYRALEKI